MAQEQGSSKAVKPGKPVKPRIRSKASSKPGKSSSVSGSADTAKTPAPPPVPTLPMMQVVPEKLQEIQSRYMDALGKVLTSKPEMLKMAAQDRRFNNPTWLDSYFSGLAALYVLNAKALNDMTDAVQTDPKTHARLKFMVQQWIDAASPANFLATNPEVQQKMIESQGESLRSGIGNLVSDMRKGRITQTDESAFEIGRNVATTPGDVVFQNELFQLIQYKPTTPTVGEVPLLMVPPSINKYYIMDLQPHSSLVKFAVDQGNTVFLISWRNVLDEDSKLTWDDYITKGVLKAIDAVLDISGQPRTNVLGFCIGGTLLATGLAALAARHEDKVASLTLMTSLLDFSDTGILDVFIDEQHVQMREQQLAKGGLLKGSELSSTFSFLRPNDLVWNYVVSNYLKGEKPVAFDLLYWNSDSTNLPGPFFAWYLRNMYLENNLIKKNRLTIAGEKMNLSAIAMPVYAMGALEDHIVPWWSAYESVKLLKGAKVHFVLGASGHIAGVINPPAKKKRNYWENSKAPATADAWFDGAKEIAGSWWPDWTDWLKPLSGKQKPAPKKYGNTKYKVLEKAPGSYVKEKAVD